MGFFVEQTGGVSSRYRKNGRGLSVLTLTGKHRRLSVKPPLRIGVNCFKTSPNNENAKANVWQKWFSHGSPQATASSIPTLYHEPYAL